jgi:hypothetical protein
LPLPDNIVDLAIAAQYGELSQGRCPAILMNENTTGHIEMNLLDRVKRRSVLYA